MKCEVLQEKIVTMNSDVWFVGPEEREKHERSFQALHPVNNKLSGEQSKKFFMKSNLPTPILGQIWTLSDLDRDGRMSLQEFTIAMHLIGNKLKGIEVPRVLPSSLCSSSIIQNGFLTQKSQNSFVTNNMPHVSSNFQQNHPPLVPTGSLSQPSQSGFQQPLIPTSGFDQPPDFNQQQLSSSAFQQTPFLASGFNQNASKSFHSTLPNMPTNQFSPSHVIQQYASTLPRTFSATPHRHPYQLTNEPDSLSSLNIDVMSGLGGSKPSMASPSNLINTIAGPNRLRYTQVFRAADNSQTGFIQGEQARQILVQSGVSPQSLAHVWDLSDINKDGCLDLEEFIIAMHLIDLVKSNISLPVTLPSSLIPAHLKTFVPTPRPERSGSMSDVMIHPASFEDRRKMNWDKGQAELERRRLELQERQKRDKEDRERKEREAEEQKRKMREEAERKRLEQLENQRRQKEEMEKEQELLRKKMIEQRQAAQLEMERQRQREWENRRMEELLNQKGLEENIVKELKSRLVKLKEELNTQTSTCESMTFSYTSKKTEGLQLHAAIEELSLSKEQRLKDISRLQSELQASKKELYCLLEEREKFAIELNKTDTTQTSEAVGAIKSSVEQMKLGVSRLRKNLTNIETETASVLKEANQINKEHMALKAVLSEQKGVRSELQDDYDKKVHEANERRRVAEINRNRIEIYNKKQEEARKKQEENVKKQKQMEYEAMQKEQQLQIMGQKIRKEAGLAELTRNKITKVETAELLTSSCPEPNKSLKIAPPRPRERPQVGLGDEPLFGIDFSHLDQKEVEHSVKDQINKVDTEGFADFNNTPNFFDVSFSNNTVKKPPPRPSPPSGMNIQMTVMDDKQNTEKLEEEKRNKIEREKRERLEKKVREENEKKAREEKEKKEKEEKAKKEREEKAKKEKEEKAKKEREEKAKKEREEKAKKEAAERERLQFEKEKSEIERLKKIKLENERKQAEEKTIENEKIKAEQLKVEEKRKKDAEMKKKIEEMQRKRFEKKKSSVTPTQKQVESGEVKQFVVRSSTFKLIFPFESRNPDELTLIEGDIVQVDENDTTVPIGWLRGVCKGKEGLFPANYASKIKKDTFSDYVDLDPTSNVINQPLTPSSNIPKSDVSTKEAMPKLKQVKKETEIKPTGNHPKFAILPSAKLKPLQPSCKQDKTTDHSDLFPLYDFVVGPAKSKNEDVQDLYAVPTKRTPAPQVEAVTDDLYQVPVNHPAVLTPGKSIKAVAIYPYHGKKDDHLSFHEGDMINIHVQQDQWWFGECNGKRGWLPKSYVSVVGSPSKNETEKASDKIVSECVAMFDYSGPEGDLTFFEGNLITVATNEGEWWNGYCNGRTGMFPGNYVKEPIKVESGKRELATVVTKYSATNVHEVSLNVGQLVHVQHKNEKADWWKGEVQVRGKNKPCGWFPSANVKLKSKGDSKPQPHPSSQISAQEDVYSVPVKRASHQVLAVFSYTAQNEDELTFYKGSVINVLSKDGEWWKGELAGQVGVFPYNYVQDLQSDLATSQWSGSFDSNLLKSMSTSERQRQNHIYELINTEQDYMNDLSLTLEVFYNPLAEMRMLSDQELNTVFVNWKELIMCNMKFLKAMLVRKKMSSTDMIEGIGDILIEQLPRFSPYIRFCSCMLKACRLLQDKVEKDVEFKIFEKQCAGDSRLKQNLPLSSYLLKPLQRITKYPLIITGILKYTPEDHFDRANLLFALEKAEDLCSQINEGVRSQESCNRLEWLQERINLEGLEEKLVFNSQTNCLGQRKYLHHGTLHKHKSNKELKVFLFNDFLMFCRLQGSHFQSKSSFGIFHPDNDMQFTIYKKVIFLNEVIVKLPTDPEVNETLFHLSHIDRVHLFRAESKNERNTWVSKIQVASQHFISTERDKRSKVSRARSLCDSNEVCRLVVTIMEGADLQASDPNGTSDPYCEVNMGSQEHRTKVISRDLNPKWNSTMVFSVKDLEKDVLCISVFDRDFFSPNDFLGRTEVSIGSILKHGDGPITKRLLLHEVATGEIVVTMELKNWKS